jgi:hypothetical protein
LKKHTIIAMIEWIVVIFLIWLFIHADFLPTGSRTPEKAHQLSEQGFHYGPSNVVRKVTVPFDKDQVIFLGTYKDWYSADTVQKKRGGWFPGGGVAGNKIDRSKGFSYSWEGVNSRSSSFMTYKIFGYVNDDEITRIELNMKEKDTDNLTTIAQDIKSDRMFLFIFKGDYAGNPMKSLRGMDQAGKIRYEEQLY